MKILNQYTRRSLRLNRTRTLVTIIGIVLSVALITAVAEGAFSGQQYLVRVQEQKVGAFAAYYSDMDAQQLAQLRSDPQVAAVTTFEQVGWADIGSQNAYKPYLYIAAAPPDAGELVGIHLIEGRFPENDGELLLPEHLYTNGAVSLQLGQTLSLEVGARMKDSTALAPNDDYYGQEEALTDLTPKTYTVVGFFNRLDSLVEPFSAAGYTALTGGTGNGSYTAFFRLKQMGRVFAYAEGNGFDNPCAVNTDLLNIYGVTGNNLLARTIYGLATILILLIMFGSVCLIYNSFSISVSERTRLFGMLKTIGATRRQLRYTVLYEALTLCAVAIPLGLLVGCVGIGITLRALEGSFAALTLGSSTVKMQLALNPAALAIAALVGLLTALISAWIPAGRMMRLTPIEAVRQTKDIAISSKQVHTARLTAKLFGFPGLLATKNYKRNRKRYRATVISLFMSLLLFISASSFSSYLRSSVQSFLSGSSYDIVYYGDQTSQDDAQTTYRLLSSVQGVTDGMLVSGAGYSTLCCPAAALSEREQTGEQTGNVYANITFLAEDDFRKLLTENGLNEADFFAADAPTALVYDHVRHRTYTESGLIYEDGNTFARSFPLTVQLQTVKQLDGYEYYDSYNDESGARLVRYLDTDYYNADDADLSDYLLELPGAEVENLTPLVLGAALEQPPLCVTDGEPCLLLPESSRQSLPLDAPADRAMYFQVENHATVYREMLRLLKDAGQDYTQLIDAAATVDSTRATVTVLDVFSYGFILLISLIAAANVFNTVSTNIALRRREFAMLKSVGMTRRGFNRMMNFECLLYGFKALAAGLPAAVLVTWLIYRAVASSFVTRFYLPWQSVVIAVCSVFAVLFATMLYSMRKIRRDNPIDALRNENL